PLSDRGLVELKVQADRGHGIESGHVRVVAVSAATEVHLTCRTPELGGDGTVSGDHVRLPRDATRDRVIPVDRLRRKPVRHRADTDPELAKVVSARARHANLPPEPSNADTLRPLGDVRPPEDVRPRLALLAACSRIVQRVLLTRVEAMREQVA